MSGLSVSNNAVLASIQQDYEDIVSYSQPMPFALTLLRERAVKIAGAEHLVAYFETKIAGGEVDAHITQWFKDHA